MINVAKASVEENSEHYLGPANVIGLASDEGSLRLSLTGLYSDCQVVARNATLLDEPLRVGDEVLVTGDVFSDMFIIGLLTPHKRQQKQVELKELKVADGSSAVLDDALGSPALKLFSKRNELLIEYSPEEGKTRINIDTGDLEFITRKGDIVFDSERNIQLKGQGIELSSKSGIKLGVLDSIGRVASSFSLGSYAATLSSAKLTIVAQLGAFQLKETRLVGSKFRGKIDDSKLVVDKLSTVANSISEKAQNVYRSAEQLTHLKTGRLRTLVASTFHLKANKSYIKSQEDFKVNADKIHLG